MEEISKHDHAQDCWIVVYGGVYDLTAFVEGHPGGAASILPLCATDASDIFSSIHSPSLLERVGEHLQGHVDVNSTVPPPADNKKTLRLVSQDELQQHTSFLLTVLLQ